MLPMVSVSMKKRGLFKELIAKNILVSTDKNHLRIFESINMSMYGGSSWPLTIQTIGKRKGKDYVFERGYSMGKDIAQELATVVKKKKAFLPKSILLVDNLIQAAGFGVVAVQFNKPKQDVILQVENNVMLDMATKMYGSKSLVGIFYAGVYSAIVSLLLDVPNCKLSFTQNKVGDKNKYIFTRRK